MNAPAFTPDQVAVIVREVLRRIRADLQPAVATPPAAPAAHVLPAAQAAAAADPTTHCPCANTSFMFADAYVTALAAEPVMVGLRALCIAKLYGNPSEPVTVLAHSTEAAFAAPNATSLITAVVEPTVDPNVLFDTLR